MQSLPAQLGDSFTVTFLYDDETTWGWGFGIDNFTVCGIPSANVAPNNDLVDKQVALKGFPNPAKDVFHVVTQKDLLDGYKSTIRIYNLYGQKMLEVSKSLSEDNAIDVSSLPINQMYLVYIKDKNGEEHSIRLLK